MNTLSVSWIVEPAINIPLFDDTLSRAIDLAVAANAAEAKEYANAQDRDWERDTNTLLPAGWRRM